MPLRHVSIPLILVFFVAVVAGTFLYGPAKRRFVGSNKTVTVRTARELDRVWHDAGVHGRVAVILARHLDASYTGLGFPEIDYLDKAFRHGIVRKAYYVVPDRDWSQAVIEHVATPKLYAPPIITESGYIRLHEGGRIYIMPLSKYIPEPGREKALVVLEPDVWTPADMVRIQHFIQSGLLMTDLLVVVRDAS